MNSTRHLTMRLCSARVPTGSTLVEVMAAMAGNMAIAALAIASLVALGRADRTFRDRADARRMATRLAEELREDIHAAEEVAWDKAKRQLRFTRPDGEAIVYQGKELQWSRRLVAAGAGGEGELAGAFAIPPRFSLEVEPENATSGDAVAVVLEVRDENRPDDENVAAEMIAIVGRDRRLLHQ